jgi:hypothetical protein
MKRSWGLAFLVFLRICMFLFERTNKKMTHHIHLCPLLLSDKERDTYQDYIEGLGII